MGGIWIRSQNKQVLIYCDNVILDDKRKSIVKSIEKKLVAKLGTYKSVERCAEILDEIESCIISNSKCVYHLPEE